MFATSKSHKETGQASIFMTNRCWRLLGMSARLVETMCAEAQRFTVSQGRSCIGCPVFCEPVFCTGAQNWGVHKLPVVYLDMSMRKEKGSYLSRFLICPLNTFPFAVWYIFILIKSSVVILGKKKSWINDVVGVGRPGLHGKKDCLT